MSLTRVFSRASRNVLVRCRNSSLLSSSPPPPHHNLSLPSNQFHSLSESSNKMIESSDFLSCDFSSRKSGFLLEDRRIRRNYGFNLCCFSFFFSKEKNVSRKMAPEPFSDVHCAEDTSERYASCLSFTRTRCL
ncbi:hypothetical protein Dimus_001007 [Dionaea muscipula]